MSTDSNQTQPINAGAHSQPEPKQAQQEASTASATHGSTGEGAGSAMARLISQEQARIVPGAPEDGSNALP